MSRHEDHICEHKSSLADWRKIVETVAAFATTEGGTVEIGVNPGGAVVGVDVGRGTAEDLANKIQQNTDPCQTPTIVEETREGRTVIVVQVAECADKPVSAFGVPMRRVGRSNRRLSMAETRRLLAETGVGRWEDRVCDRATFADLSQERIEWFVEKAAQRDQTHVGGLTDAPEVLLDRLRLLRNGELTRAAVALFGSEPSSFHPQLQVRCAVFADDRAIDFADMQVFEGDLFSQIEDATQWVALRTRTAVVIDGRPERREYPAYAPTAVREAITNAVCHRRYDDTGHVQIRMCPSHLEIWNPGLLLPGLTVESLRGPHRSIPRNPLIANAMFRAGMIEHWGTGTNRIIDDSLHNLAPEPVFHQRDGDETFTVRIAPSVVTRGSDGGYDDRKLKALQFVHANGCITNEHLRAAAGVSANTALRDLNELVELGVLSRVGRGRSTRYEFAHRYADRK